MKKKIVYTTTAAETLKEEAARACAAASASLHDLNDELQEQKTKETTEKNLMESGGNVFDREMHSRAYHEAFYRVRQLEKEISDQGRTPVDCGQADADAALESMENFAIALEILITKYEDFQSALREAVTGQIVCMECSSKVGGGIAYRTAKRNSEQLNSLIGGNAFTRNRYSDKAAYMRGMLARAEKDLEGLRG